MQQSADYDEYRQRRVMAEHRLARLVQLGMRQARYFGRVKTKFQLYLAATVANLTLLVDQTGLTGNPDPDLAAFTIVADVEADGGGGQRGNLIGTLIYITLALQTISPFPKHTFRLNF